MSLHFTRSATAFRIIFGVIFVVMIAAAIGLSWLGANFINERSKEVQQVAIAASTDDIKLAALRKQVADYNDNAQAVDLAEKIVAESKSYAYQNRIIEDLQVIANRNGVTVLSYDFSGGDGSASAAPSTPATTTPPSTSSDATASAASTLKTTTVSISFETPIEYEKLLNFMHSIEQNPTKMQITRVSLSRAEPSENDPRTNVVTSDAFEIEVYIR